MKLIGILPRIREVEHYNEIRTEIDLNWSHLIKQCGFVPIILPYDKGSLSQICKLAQYSGTIITGGNNIPQIEETKINIIRQEIENFLIEDSFKKSMPLIGYCKGAQSVACYFKNPLISIENHIAKRHDVFITKMSFMYSIYGGKFQVNSYHQYGLNKLSSEFEILATDVNQYIEAFKLKKSNIWGVLWHPEREEPFKIEDINFIRRVINESNNSSRR